MRALLRSLCAAALSATLLPALAADVGPYAEVTLGRTHYDVDCSLYFSCNGGRAGAGRIGGGYQFEVFALEGWLTEWGRAPLNDGFGGDHVRLRSWGVSGAWHWRISPAVQGVGRVGAARVRQTRSTENFSNTEATLGLALLVDVTPAVAVQLAWDATSSTGGSSHVGTALAQAVTGGVRLRF